MPLQCSKDVGAGGIQRSDGINLRNIPVAQQALVCDSIKREKQAQGAFPAGGVHRRQTDGLLRGAAAQSLPDCSGTVIITRNCIFSRGTTTSVSPGSSESLCGTCLESPDLSRIYFRIDQNETNARRRGSVSETPPKGPGAALSGHFFFQSHVNKVRTQK